MNENTQIIETYKKADFEKRLNLFLSHRSLRGQFTKIDNREKRSATGLSPVSRPEPEKGSFFQRLLLRWI